MRPLFVDVDVQRVRVAKKFWLQDMQGRMTVTGSWPTGLDASARYHGGSLVAASLPDSAGRIRVGASDFGALMRATGASSAVGRERNGTDHRKQGSIWCAEYGVQG